LPASENLHRLRQAWFHLRPTTRGRLGLLYPSHCPRCAARAKELQAAESAVAKWERELARRKIAATFCFCVSLLLNIEHWVVSMMLATSIAGAS
jgi:hypothetical protein